jgi:hypothetical protein
VLASAHRPECSGSAVPGCPGCRPLLWVLQRVLRGVATVGQAGCAYDWYVASVVPVHSFGARHTFLWFSLCLYGVCQHMGTWYVTMTCMLCGRDVRRCAAWLHAWHVGVERAPPGVTQRMRHPCWQHICIAGVCRVRESILVLVCVVDTGHLFFPLCAACSAICTRR